MQKVSAVRRISTNYRSITETSIIFTSIILYGAISTMYPFLPPLFGFMVVLFVETGKKYFFWILAFFLFYEAEHNHIAFSSWIFLYLYFRFVLPVLKNFLACKVCIHVLNVVLSYLLFYALNYIFYFIVGDVFININWGLLGLYLLLESILVALFV